MITVYYNKNKEGKYTLAADCSHGVNGVDYNWFFYVGQLIGERLGELLAISPLVDADCHKYKRLVVSAHKSPKKACDVIVNAIVKLLRDKRKGDK